MQARVNCFYAAPATRAITRRRSEDPAVMEIVQAAASKLGVTRREISDEEIVSRLTTALINEGARILEEGIAQRPGDIDVVYVYGYGFPRFPCARISPSCAGSSPPLLSG